MTKPYLCMYLYIICCMGDKKLRDKTCFSQYDGSYAAKNRCLLVSIYARA